MASPHVAGVAAVLLAAQPELTLGQVRWQIGLNADQIGATGYETALWNPYLGLGPHHNALESAHYRA